jgi:integrase
MRGLFEWAKEAQHVRQDPTAGVKAPPRPKTQGVPSWNEDDIARFEARWPIGTRQRVWLDVLCFTGGRRGDAAVLGRQHVRPGNVLTWRTEKGGEEIEVTIPILPVLATTIAAGPCGDLTFICGAQGRPLTKESFGNMFSEAARAAGVAKSAHGVRKIAATRAADNGATVHQLMAIFGWKTPAMALLYTQEANRRRLAREAAHLLVNIPQTSIPAPLQEVRAPGKKEQ